MKLSLALALVLSIAAVPALTGTDAAFATEAPAPAASQDAPHYVLTVSGMT